MKNLIKELKAKLGRALTTQDRRAMKIAEEHNRFTPMPDELVEQEIEQLRFELSDNK